MQIDLTEIVSEALMTKIRQESDTEAAPVMAVGAILAVDVLHEDGLHYLHTFRPDETTAWQAVGMAEFIKGNALDDRRDDDE